MKNSLLGLSCMLAFARAASAAPPEEAPPNPKPDAHEEQPAIDAAKAVQAAEIAKKDAKIAKAEAETKVAEAEATDSRNAAKEAEASLDLAKSGKLMSSGITAGGARAIQTRAPWGGEQKGTDVVAMPYLMVLPGYFGAPQPKREYCASAWGVGDDASATAAATGAARKVARKLLDAIKADLRISMSVDDVVAAWFPDAQESQKQSAVAKKIVETTQQAITKQKDPQTKQEGVQLEESALDSLTARAWNPTLRGKCGLNAFGLWLGKPLSYTTSTRVDGDTKDREVKPIIAFGIGYTPHAYFSMLLGLTLATVKKSEDATSSNTTWATTVGIGGNLDLLGSLFK
jgi:hypothetical protein